MPKQKRTPKIRVPVQYRTDLERLSKRTRRSIPTLVREARAASKLPRLGRVPKSCSVLEREYRRFNKKFFGNRLPNPPAIVLRWANLKGLVGHRHCNDIRCNTYRTKTIRPLSLEPLPATPEIPSVLHRQGGQVVYGASPARVRQDGTKASILAG